MAWRLTSELMRSGRVPASQPCIRSRTKSSFCGCRFSGCKAVALGPLWRFRGRSENEIERRGGLRTILNTVHGLSVSRGTVDVSQTTQTSRLGRVVSLELQKKADRTVTLRRMSARALRREASKDKRTVIRTGPVASRAHAGARVSRVATGCIHSCAVGTDCANGIVCVGFSCCSLECDEPLSPFSLP